jgi:hypothetical protein
VNGKAITLVGSIATAIWLLLIAAYVWAKWSCFLTMEPNSLGDFVAGAFGPLALFWLVCGYFQQGLELRQNTEALKLQVEELRNSVTHQAQMAEASQRQVQLEMERLQEERSRDQALRDGAAPKLNVVYVNCPSSYRGGNTVDVIVDIKNLGDDLELLEYVGHGLAREVTVQGNLKALQTIRVRVTAIPLQEQPNSTVVLKLRDKLGRRHEVVLGLLLQVGAYSVELVSLGQAT